MEGRGPRKLKSRKSSQPPGGLFPTENLVDSEEDFLEIGGGISNHKSGCAVGDHLMFLFI